MDVLSQLNSSQREAVETIEGPVLILAGPGSGKTRVITHRVAYLIKTCGISPYRIMAVTFTNKAAKEMTERLEKLVSGSIPSLTLGTFHAICARILRRDGKPGGVHSDFVIYDDEDQINLVKSAVQELNLDPKKFVPRAILSAISLGKSQMLLPENYLQASRSYLPEIYPGRTALFQAAQPMREAPSGSFRDHKIHWGEFTSWQRFAPKPIEIYTIPGNHYTMLTEPNVRILAEQLEKCLAQADRFNAKLSAVGREIIPSHRQTIAMDLRAK